MEGTVGAVPLLPLPHHIRLLCQAICPLLSFAQWRCSTAPTSLDLTTFAGSLFQLEGIAAPNILEAERPRLGPFAQGSQPNRGPGRGGAVTAAADTFASWAASQTNTVLASHTNPDQPQLKAAV